MNLFILTFPDFPYLADEIAEPLPEMNIKVAAFTVIEKSSKTCTLKKKYHLKKSERVISLNISKATESN